MAHSKSGQWQVSRCEEMSSACERAADCTHTLHHSTSFRWRCHPQRTRSPQSALALPPRQQRKQVAASAPHCTRCVSSFSAPPLLSFLHLQPRIDLTHSPLPDEQTCSRNQRGCRCCFSSLAGDARIGR